MLATQRPTILVYVPHRARRGVSILFVLALVSMTLALSYAALRTQATNEQTERNSSHRATARQAAMTGMSVALRTISQPTWGGVDAGLSGNLGDGSTYAITFQTGDVSLAVGDPDYAEYPYRLTITSTGSVVDPANPKIQATHQVRSVVQLVRRKLLDTPAVWSTMQPYSVYQWGTGTGREVDIAFAGGQVERQHDRAKWPDVLDPCFLAEECRQVIVGDDQDRVVGRVPRQDHGGDARLVRFMRDAVEAGQIEDVVGRGRDDAVETTSGKRMQHAVEVAETLRQRRPGEG